MLELNFNITLWCRGRTLGPAHLWNSWRNIFGQTGFVKCGVDFESLSPYCHFDTKIERFVLKILVLILSACD